MSAGTSDSSSENLDTSAEVVSDRENPQRPQETNVRCGLSRDPLVWLATGMGVGCVRVAPGTFGSLWGLPIMAALTGLGVASWSLVPIAVVLFLLGVPICAAGARHFGREDPPGVVYDEYAMFPVIYVLVPFGWLSAVLGFALFRLFDITKPWPIKRLEHLPGGWGIMMDDLLAAILAMLVLAGLAWLLPGWLGT